MRRVTVADIMRESQLSRATVDRVLNGRGRVHPRTRAVVEDTLRRLSLPERTGAAAGPPVDIVLRLGRGMLGHLRAVWDRCSPAGAFHDMYQAGEDEMLEVLRTACGDVSRPLIVTAKNTDRIGALLQEARSRGKRVIALISDLAVGARDVFVGIDNRAAGRTAAYLIGRALGDRRTLAGVVLGDPAFRCHEDREIGFRTALRTEFPTVVLAGEAIGEDNPEQTQNATRRLLSAQPGLAAIYNVGAANQGVVEALKAAGRASDMLLIGHETYATNVSLLRGGSMDFALAQDPGALLREALELARSESLQQTREHVLLDFAVYTRFNVPGFAQSPAVP